MSPCAPRVVLHKVVALRTSLSHPTVVEVGCIKIDLSCHVRLHHEFLSVSFCLFSEHNIWPLCLMQCPWCRTYFCQRLLAELLDFRNADDGSCELHTVLGKDHVLAGTLINSNEDALVPNLATRHWFVAPVLESTYFAKCQ